MNSWQTTNKPERLNSKIEIITSKIQFHTWPPCKHNIFFPNSIRHFKVKLKSSLKQPQFGVSQIRVEDFFVINKFWNEGLSAGSTKCSQLVATPYPDIVTTQTRLKLFSPLGIIAGWKLGALSSNISCMLEHCCTADISCKIKLHVTPTRSYLLCSRVYTGVYQDIRVLATYFEPTMHQSPRLLE